MPVCGNPEQMPGELMGWVKDYQLKFNPDKNEVLLVNDEGAEEYMSQLVKESLHSTWRNKFIVWEWGWILAYCWRFGSHLLHILSFISFG